MTEIIDKNKGIPYFQFEKNNHQDKNQIHQYLQKYANIDHFFVPDILLLVDYSSHSEKVDLLMNMSRRIAYISTTDFDVTRSWLAYYANFIHVDMFSESAYNILTTKYLKEFLAKSPANKNYMVAYTFGVYSAQILNNTGIHIWHHSPIHLHRYS